jgi:N-acetylmuramoyl-L-alanine amidase
MRAGFGADAVNRVAGSAAGKPQGPHGTARRRVLLRLLAIATALVLLTAAAYVARAATAERTVRPILVDYPEPRPSERIKPILIGGATYVSTNDLARVFSATKYWRPDMQKLSLRIGEHTIRFTVGAPLVLIDDAGWNLVMPARLIQGIVFVPEPVVAGLFERGLIGGASYDEPSRTVRFRGEVHTIRQVQLYPRGRVTEVSATLLRGLPPRVLYATPSEIRVIFEGGTLDTAKALSGGVVVDGWVREIPGAVDLRLDLADGAQGYSISVGSGRLKVSITDDKSLVESGLFTELEPAPIGGRDRNVRVIVIDPGHGGSDKGVTLPGGMVEKDAALDMARALRSALQQRLGARVILTREGDDDVSVTRRAEIANESHADLFLSVHLDAQGSLKGGGFRVLTLSPLAASSETQGDNMPEDVDGVPLRPWLGAQTNVVGSSLALAQAVADSLTHAFPQTSVVLTSGRVRVLEPVACPALFLESAPAARSGPEALSRGYTIYDYTRIVADAIERVVRMKSG